MPKMHFLTGLRRIGTSIRHSDATLVEENFSIVSFPESSGMERAKGIEPHSRLCPGSLSFSPMKECTCEH
jgi:hypothetical protein